VSICPNFGGICPGRGSPSCCENSLPEAAREKLLDECRELKAENARLTIENANQATLLRAQAAGEDKAYMRAEIERLKQQQHKLLTKYSEYLEQLGYLASDWRTPPPLNTAVDRFLEDAGDE